MSGFMTRRFFAININLLRYVPPEIPPRKKSGNNAQPYPTSRGEHDINGSHIGSITILTDHLSGDLQPGGLGQGLVQLLALGVDDGGAGQRSSVK